MIYARHHILPLLMLCCISGYAQSFNYEGKVLDEQDKPMADVAVAFLRGNKSIAQFAFTNEKGVFSLSLEEEPAFISFSYLGYRNILMPATAYRAGSVFRMLSSDIKLNEVKVKSNRVQVHEDTLAYAVSGFRMPQDRSIADVLKKMPGLEVLPGGTIRFEDKNISKLYIEGMDLMGNNYGLATNNLSGRAIKKVEILRNHQQIAALRGKNFSEQVAINLVLEDDVKFTLSGTLDAGGGIHGSKGGLWDIRALGIFFGKKHQNLSLYQGNNAGINTANELRPQINEAEWALSESASLLNVPRIDMDLIDEIHYLDNRDHLAASNHLVQFNKETSLRAQFNYLHSVQQQENEVTTRYFYPGKTVSYDEVNETSLESGQLQAEITFERNASKGFVKNKFSGNWRKNTSGQAFVMNRENMFQAIGATHKQLADRLQLVLPLNEKHIFKLASLNSWEELPQRLRVSPGIFPNLLNDSTSYGSFYQQVNLSNFYTKNTTDWQFKLFNFYIAAKLGVDYARQALASGIKGTQAGGKLNSSADFKNDMAFSDLRLHASPDIHYQKGGLRMNFILPFSYHIYRLDDATGNKGKGNFNKFFVEPSLNASYEISPLWTVIQSVMYRYQVPGINQLYSRYIFTQYREASKGTDFYTFSNWVSYTTLKFNNPLSGLFWSLTGNVLVGKHEKMAKAVQDGMLHATEMIGYKHETLTWNIRGRLSKAFAFWKAFVGISAQYMENRQKVMIAGQVVPYRTKSVTLTGNYALQPGRYVSIEGSERLGHTALSSGITPGNYAFGLVNKLDLNIFPSSLWKFKWSNAWYLNDGPARSSIYFMSFSLAYSPKAFGLELLAKNVLNKRMYQQNTLTSLSERIVNQSFRPREILLKANYSF